MSSERILIVDDDPINLKLITTVLQRNGYVVSTAGDGRSVPSLCETFRPNLILMDIQLPGIDGLELTRRLKADPANGDLVVVVMTAFTMKGDEQRALEGGCDGYMKKPIHASTLPALIEGYLAERRKTHHVVSATVRGEVMNFEEFRN